MVWTRVRNWWYRERFISEMLERLEQGVGVQEATWTAGTDVEAVLAWYDAQIATARRPYGMSTCLLAFAPSDATVPQWERQIGRTLPWWGDVRDDLAAQLAPLLTTNTVKTACIAFGTAMHATLKRY